MSNPAASRFIENARGGLKLSKHALRPETEFYMDYHNYTKYNETEMNVGCGDIKYACENLPSNVGPFAEDSENFVFEDNII